MNIQNVIVNPVHEDLLGRARSATEIVKAEADKSEAIGTMTDSVIDYLRSSELFWLLVPRKYGGLQVNLATCIEIWEEFASADASAGWSFMANATTIGIAAGYCEEQAVEEMFSAAKKPIMAGMLGPGGSCTESPEGYEGGGSYRFGSGCKHADWFGAGMFVVEDSVMKKMPNGEPLVQVAFFPRSAVTLKDNWDVLGLRGTGSVDYDISKTFVPRGYTFERTTTRGLRDWRIYDMGVVGIACAGHSAIALGMMKRALEEIAAIARTRKRPGYKAVLGEQAVFRHEFAYHEAAYQAARAYTLSLFSETHAFLEAGGTLSAARRQRFRQNVTYTHKVASDVVRFCHIMGGSDSLRNPHVLGRLMRDVHTATQHVVVDTIGMVDIAGPILEEWSVVK